MELTCNRAMVLLDIYRGTFDPNRHMGTCPGDLRWLSGMDLIVFREESDIRDWHWDIMSDGKREIERMLGKK